MGSERSFERSSSSEFWSMMEDWLIVAFSSNSSSFSELQIIDSSCEVDATFSKFLTKYESLFVAVFSREEFAAPVGICSC